MVWFEFARPSVAHYFESLFDKATGAGHASDSIAESIAAPHRGLSWRSLSLSLQGPQSAGQSSARQQPPSTIKKKRQKKKGHVLDLWPIFNKPQHLLREPIKHHGKQSASSNTHICLLLPNVPIMMFDFPLCSNERWWKTGIVRTPPHTSK